MVSVEVAKYEFTSGIRERQELGHSISKPLESLVSETGTKDQQGKGELQTQSPHNDTPAYLKMGEERWRL